MRSIGKDTRGAVYVEFLLVFIPMFTIFLGLVQMSLMFAANLVVTHAATTAARAAAVVLDDQEKYYSDDERDQTSSGGEGESVMDKVDSFLEWAGMGSSSSSGGAGGASGSGNARLSAIRSAASMPLVAVSPSMESLIGDATVYKAIGGSGADRALTGAAIYNRAAVAVTFPTGPRQDSFESDFGKNDDVTVRVTYLFHCAVPLVNRIMCDDIVSLRTGVPLEAIEDLAHGVSSGTAGPGEIIEMTQRVRDGRARLEAEAPGVSELNSAESPNLAYLTALTGSRFHILRSEATMPNHGADYTYADDSGGGGE